MPDISDLTPELPRLPAIDQAPAPDIEHALNHLTAALWFYAEKAVIQQIR
jgi:hypothetical protein